MRFQNNYEFKKWAWRKNSGSDIGTIIINEDYIPGTNVVYDSYLYRKNKNNMYRTNMERDLKDIECYMKLYNKTNEEMFVELYNIAIEHYNDIVSEYNKNYPKYDNFVIYVVKDKKFIYPNDWE